MQASNRRTEIEGIAREIHSLIRQGRFRLRDIAVIARNVEDYKDTIKEVLKTANFLFHRRQGIDANHPLIELIRSTLDIIKGNWRYEAVFRCVKRSFYSRKDSRRNGCANRLTSLKLLYCLWH
ncbi:hypothetical protein PO124_10500 [Bacillus licheniformis]|nr:hypothetical protein [Bacillus licheniformis]